MVKTIEQWFDSLSQEKKFALYRCTTQELIKAYDKDGNDRGSDGCIRDKFVLEMNFLDKHTEENACSSYLAFKDSYKYTKYQVLINMSRLIQADKNLISDREIDEFIKDEYAYLSMDTLKEIITRQTFKVMSRKLANKAPMDQRLLMCIFASENPENPEWSLLLDDSENHYRFDRNWFNIIPFEEVLKLARKNVSLLIPIRSYINQLTGEAHRKLKNRFFEFLFSEDGLGIKDRMKAIIKVYSVEEFPVFVNEILSVDIRYFKLLPDIFREKRLDSKDMIRYLTDSLNLRKREYRTDKEYEQEDFFESPEADDFRYGKKLRSMLAVYKACLLKKIIKTHASIIGDGLCLLKMYDFNFQKIFDALYGDSDC